MPKLTRIPNMEWALLARTKVFLFGCDQPSTSEALKKHRHLVFSAVPYRKIGMGSRNSQAPVAHHLLVNTLSFITHTTQESYASCRVGSYCLLEFLSGPCFWRRWPSYAFKQSLWYIHIYLAFRAIRLYGCMSMYYNYQRDCH